MRIGEVAERSGLTVKTIRFYEQAGVLPPPQRLESGYRDYDDEALARLAFVKAAQAAGLSLAEIRRVIAVRDEAGPPCQHVVDLLHAHVADLNSRIAELTELREQVGRLLDRAARLDPAACEGAQVCQVIPTQEHPPHPRE